MSAKFITLHFGNGNREEIVSLDCGFSFQIIKFVSVGPVPKFSNVSEEKIVFSFPHFVTAVTWLFISPTECVGCPWLDVSLQSVSPAICLYLRVHQPLHCLNLLHHHQCKHQALFSFYASDPCMSSAELSIK